MLVHTKRCIETLALNNAHYSSPELHLFMSTSSVRLVSPDVSNGDLSPCNDVPCNIPYALVNWTKRKYVLLLNVSNATPPFDHSSSRVYGARNLPSSTKNQVPMLVTLIQHLKCGCTLVDVNYLFDDVFL